MGSQTLGDKRTTTAFWILLVTCGLSSGHGLLIRDNSIPRTTTVEDELGTLFKGDKFFTDFDQNVKQRKQLVLASSSSPSPSSTMNQTSTATPAIPDGQGAKFDLQNVRPESTTTDCSTQQKTFLDTANEGITSITDSLLGIIGLSTMQTAIKPVIMILVAGVTGFFWAVVFWYIYSNFFTGGGYFGGDGGGAEVFGLGDFLKKGKKKDKYNKYNHNSGWSSSSAYGRSSDIDFDWDYYTTILSNLASWGWDTITASGGVE